MVLPFFLLHLYNIYIIINYRMQQIRNFILFLGLWLTSLVAQAQQILPFSKHFETGSRTIFCTFRDADGIWWNGTSQGLFTSAQLMGSANRVYKRHPELENNIVQIQQDNMGGAPLVEDSG